MKRFKEKLWMLSGANVFILRTAPSDQSKFSWIGVSLLLTAITATITFGFAISTVFDNYFPYGFIASILWGLIILSIDCMVVASISDHQRTKDSDDGFKMPLSVIIRIVISIFIGLVIAKPLEFKIFEKEIKARLEKTALKDCESLSGLGNNQKVNQIMALSEQRDSIIIVMANQTLDQKCLSNALTREKQGIGGTLQCHGIDYVTSPIAGMRENYHRWEKQKLNLDTAISRNQIISKKLSKSIDSTQALVNRAYDGCSVDNLHKKVESSKPTILEAYVALGMISSSEDAALGAELDKANQAQAKKASKIATPVVKGAPPQVQGENIEVIRAQNANRGIWFVTLLIVLIELCPVMLKTIQKTPAYDAALTRYLTDVTDNEYDYLALIAKYPFLGDADSLAKAYEKKKEAYEKLIPQLQRINELNGEANANFEILTDKLETQKAAAKNLNTEMGETIKDTQRNVMDKVMQAWEDEMLKKVKDDPGQFWGEPTGNKSRYQQSARDKKEKKNPSGTQNGSED